MNKTTSQTLWCFCWTHDAAAFSKWMCSSGFFYTTLYYSTFYSLISNLPPDNSWINQSACMLLRCLTHRSFIARCASVSSHNNLPHQLVGKCLIMGILIQLLLHSEVHFTNFLASLANKNVTSEESLYFLVSHRNCSLGFPKSCRL